MKIFKKVMLCVISCIMLFTLCACGDGSHNDVTDDVQNNTQAQIFTVKYADDAGIHTLEVNAGKLYSIETIPHKNGYDFMGLYDAEVGGVQYVSSMGISLSPFTDKKDIVLYPQFRAKEYTLVLDYQGADVTGNREYKVSYNGRLPELPKNLNLEHKEFNGWYTKENCSGTKVADSYGLIPDKAIINEDIFDLSNKNGFIYLYAGFEGEKHTVIFCYETGMDTEEVQVPYNTPISEVVPDTRVIGQAVLTWSKTQGGEVWNGKVTNDMVLYAVEYAPVIEFDTNGGSKVNAMVARAGSTIALPTPTKDLAKFAYWEDMQGNRFTTTIMPSKSLSLKAVWQAMLEFDENGGTEVDDISVEAGNTIELPMPEREGFIFAGWYTDKKEKYTSEIMPADGIRLKAGWYKTRSKKKVLNDSISISNHGEIVCKKNPEFDSLSNSGGYINFTEEVSELDWTKPITVDLEFRVDIRHSSSKSHPTYATKEHFYFYSQKEISDLYLLDHIILDHGKNEINENFVTMEFSTQLTIPNGNLYMAFAADKDNYDKSYGGYRAGWDMRNFWVVIYYPDTANLYL